MTFFGFADLSPEEEWLQSGRSGELLAANVRLWLSIVVTAGGAAFCLRFRHEPESWVVLLAGSAALAFAILLRQWARRAMPPRWLDTFSCLYDVSLVSAANVGFVLSGSPLAATNGRVVFCVYFIALGFTALRQNVRLTLLAGAVAILQYAAIAVWVGVFAKHVVTEAYGAFRWDSQVARLVVLALGTAVNAAIVRQSRVALRYRDVVEHSLDCVCLHKVDGTLLSVNPAFLSAIGATSEEEVAGMSIRDFLLPEARPQYGRYVERLERDGFAEGRMNVLTRRGDVRIFEYRNTLRRTAKGAVVRGVARDVTDAVKAERDLAASEQRFRDLFERGTTAASLTTTDGNIIAINPAGLRLLGYTDAPEQFLGVPIQGFFSDPADRERLVRKALAEGEVSGFETEILHADGRRLWVTLTATVLEYGPPFGQAILTVAADITAKKILETTLITRLRQTASDYETLVENVHDPILVLDPETETVLDANLAASAVYGLRKEELIGRSMLEFSLPGAPERSPEVLASLGFVRFTTTQYRADGREMELDVTAGRVDYRGRPAILSMNRDVTEQLRFARERERAYSILRTTLDSTADAILVISGDALLMWNEPYLRMWEVTDAEMRRSTVTELRARLTALAVDQVGFAEVVKRGSTAPEAPTLDVIPLRDGRIVERYTRPLTIEGSDLGRVISLRDVTARVTREAQERADLLTLAKVAREWRATFDGVPHPMLVLGDDLSVRRANEAACTLLGCTFRDLDGRTLASFSDAEPWHSVVSAAERDLDGTFEITDAATEAVWEISITRRRGTALLGNTIVFLRDVTATHELQKAVRRSETMSAMGALVAGVAHEVRNPLFGISAAIDAMEASSTIDVIPGKYIDRLRGDVWRLNRLMTDLLDYGRPREHQLRPARIERLLTATILRVTPLALEKEILLSAAPATDLEVLADAERLGQVFSNLIENAMQHSPRGGKVAVEVQAETRREAPWVVIRVCDAGPGFAPADLHRVFEPFFTRRRGGTGLGLSIVAKIVEQHGGTVTASNGSAGGGVVEVALPRVTLAR